MDIRYKITIKFNKYYSIKWAIIKITKNYGLLHPILNEGWIPDIT